MRKFSVGTGRTSPKRSANRWAEALGAGKKLGRVNHVRRALRVDVHGEAGIFAHQRAGSAGVVQVDVRQKNGVEITHANAAGLELLAQSIQRGARAGSITRVAVRFQ